MYRILDSNGATIEEQSSIKYVKMQHNGLCRLCRKEEADGIVAADNETYYALRGRWMDGMGYEVVTVEEFMADDAIIDSMDSNTAQTLLNQMEIIAAQESQDEAIAQILLNQMNTEV